MGLLDDALSKAAPGGSISKPLMIALGALLVGKMLHSGGSSPTLQPSQADSAPQPDGGLVGGLGGLLNKLEAAGHGDKAQSWVGSGQNKPIEPGQLGAALGQQTVSQAAQQSGMSEQQLLSQLAAALPGVVNQLTASGKIPSLQELANAFTQQQR